MRNWIVWEWAPRPGGVKAIKKPISAVTRKSPNWQLSASHTTYDIAVAYAKEHKFAGVGYVFKKGDGFTGVDFDNCYDPNTKEFEPWAQERIDARETYCEFSPSSFFNELQTLW